MNRLKQAFEFIAPSTPTGFLTWGWVGSVLANILAALFSTTSTSWLIPLLLALAIFAPLWVRARRVREEQTKLYGIIHDIHKSLASDEEEVVNDRDETKE